MAARIAVVGAGSMGSGIARVLTAHGAEVPTLLAGRSAATRARAEAAGMRDAAEAELAEADILLSIVPPAEAMRLAQHLADTLRTAARKPVFVDLNALDVQTVRAVGETVAATGASFVDGGIIGTPPKDGTDGPTLYLSGDDAPRIADVLGKLGLKVRPIGGGIGAASALKMSYAGITKGLTAVASIMILGAIRAGADGALVAELLESQPQLASRFARGLPDMAPKAYRWEAEMREIAAFLRDDPAGAAIFEGAAQLYGRLAGGGREIDTLMEFAARLRV